ncbi:MAG: hypothetical protein MNSN_11070 [Minisyncoccus archaeiphilus]|nr:MAG: hypothetical protein MNSN_11070 [Candidatus Parcubacteria bacterium]
MKNNLPSVNSIPPVITFGIRGIAELILTIIIKIPGMAKRSDIAGGERRLALTKKSLCGPTASNNSGGGLLFSIDYLIS